MKTFTDLKIDPSSLVDDRDWLGFVFLDGRAWERPGAECRCQVCGDQPLRINMYCSYCDNTGLTEHVDLPGLPVADPEVGWEDVPDFTRPYAPR